MCPRLWKRSTPRARPFVRKCTSSRCRWLLSSRDAVIWSARRGSPWRVRSRRRQRWSRAASSWRAMSSIGSKVRAIVRVGKTVGRTVPCLEAGSPPGEPSPAGASSRSTWLRCDAGPVRQHGRIAYRSPPRIGRLDRKTAVRRLFPGVPPGGDPLEVETSRYQHYVVAAGVRLIDNLRFMPQFSETQASRISHGMFHRIRHSGGRQGPRRNCHGTPRDPDERTF